eukprot:TRINITY_DN3130_c0_g1_i2.p1 TRINITY_DN3130_c0_g1~~TRINITY_DN3130_c0_g1_i2.p1  ORF type:complete len:100 (-),score=15.68 TRINITY_DN3130_c0_g1_i2:95-394(-)
MSQVAAAAKKDAFRKIWLQAGAIPMQFVFVMGTAAVLFAGVHQFYFNNTIVINKSHKRQWEDIDSPKFVSDQYREENCPHRKFFDFKSMRVINPFDKSN